MIDEGPLVSIIIPVYNVESYLVEALESVREQTYGNFEAIVVDDGSTDGSGAVCNEYATKDTRFRVVHQENGGLSAARNTGLDTMRGEVVSFLDSDDALMSTFIERMLDAMVRADADVSICRYTAHRTMGKLKKKHKQAFPTLSAGTYGRVDTLRAIVNGTLNVSVWNKLYRRKLWDDIRFPVGHVYEDWYGSIGIFDRCNAAIVLDEPLYLYRRERPGSITTTSSVQNTCDSLMAKSYLNMFVTDHMPEVFGEKQLRKCENARICNAIASYVRLLGLRDDEAREFRKGLRTNIIDMVNEKGIEDGLTWRTRIAYQMMISCPWLLPPAYRIFHPLRMLALRVFGK